MRTVQQSAYEILGLSVDFTSEDIKKRYQQLVRENPPEQKPNEFMAIREAYDLITKRQPNTIMPLFVYRNLIEKPASLTNKKEDDISNEMLKQYFEVPFSLEVELDPLIKHKSFVIPK
jgi:curved DNA-binding protein CbpA